MEAASQPDASPRILFIDDEQDALLVYGHWCRQWGFQSMGVADPTQAVEVAGGFTPDLVFMDVSMPLIDGFELIERFRKDPRLAETPVVLLSGSAIDVPDKVRGLGEGAIDYLVKPIDAEEMLARIRNYLGLSERARRHAELREMKAIKQTATFLNHSISNLLATIQAASELSAEEGDEEAQQRHELIGQNVKAIAEIVQRLREIKRVMGKTYAGLEDMLDLEASVDGEKKGK